MSDTLDHPNVVVFPPIIPLITIAIGCALQWLAPLGWLASIGYVWRIPVGIILVIAGLFTTASGRRAMMRQGTNVSPTQPTTALVIEGAFKRTRNPLYFGVLVAQFGIAIIFALDWLVLLIGPSWLILHFGVVLREERYLEQKFGEDYRRYKQQVSRYVWTF